VSIGIAEGPDTPEALLQDADVALYEAKATGKQHAVVFSPSMQDALDDRRGLENDLRGPRAGQFVVRYLATTELATGRDAGIQARLTWHHPSGGGVPETFVRPSSPPGSSCGGPVAAADRLPGREAWHRSGLPLTVWWIFGGPVQPERFADDVGRPCDSGFDPPPGPDPVRDALADDGPTTIDRLHR